MGDLNYPNESIELVNVSGAQINPATEDGNLASIKTDTDHLDVNLSTRATEVTLAAIKAQTDKLTFSGPSLEVTSSAGFATRTDTYTATGSGTAIDVHTSPLKAFALQIKGTGAAPTAWDIVLEGSLDGVNYTTILEHKTAVGDGQTMWTGEFDSPCMYFRSRVVSLTLGSATNVVVTILGD